MAVVVDVQRAITVAAAESNGFLHDIPGRADSFKGPVLLRRGGTEGTPFLVVLSSNGPGEDKSAGFVSFLAAAVHGCLWSLMLTGSPHMADAQVRPRSIEGAPTPHMPRELLCCCKHALRSCGCKR